MQVYFPFKHTYNKITELWTEIRIGSKVGGQNLRREAEVG